MKLFAIIMALDGFGVFSFVCLCEYECVCMAASSKVITSAPQCVMQREDGGRVLDVQSQLALFFASSESARTCLVGSLMRMRTLDIAIQQHIKASEAVKAQINDDDARAQMAAAASSSRKRPRCEEEGGTATEAGVSPSCDDVRPSPLRQQLDFHCDAAVALSLERRGAALNSVHCAQDVYLMWRLRRANLARCLQLHTS